MERHGVRALQASNNNGGVVRHVILREVAQAARLMCALLRSPLLGVRGDGALSGLKRRLRPLPQGCGVAAQIPASSDSVAAVIAAVGCRHNFAASPPRSAWPACDRIAVLRLAIIDTSNPAQVAGGGQPAFVRAVVRHLHCDVAALGEAAPGVPLGIWTRVDIGGRDIPYLPLLHTHRGRGRPALPSRLTALAALQLRRRRVLPWADLLYVHSPELVLPFAGQAWAPPVVLHIHGNAHPLAQSRYPWARSGLSRHIYTRLVRNGVLAAQLLIVVDEGGVGLATELAGVDVSSRCARVPTCFDETVFNVGTRAFELPYNGRPIHVVFAARVESGKGLELLLRALALLLERGVQVRLDVAGDGTQRIAMQRLAEELGLATRTCFLGWQTPEELAVVLRTADVFALPSANEGMSIAALEALACGTPVLTSGVGAMPEVVSHEVNGLVLEDLSPRRIADGLRHIGEMGLARNVVAASVRKFGSERVAAQIEELLWKQLH